MDRHVRCKKRRYNKTDESIAFKVDQARLQRFEAVVIVLSIPCKVVKSLFMYRCKTWYTVIDEVNVMCALLGRSFLVNRSGIDLVLS